MAASRYEQNEEFFTKMFNEPDKMSQIMYTVGTVLYERLKKKVYKYDPKPLFALADKVISHEECAFERRTADKLIRRKVTTLAENKLPEYESTPDGAFVFHCNGRLPIKSWSNMLTNGSFGYIADHGRPRDKAF